MVTTNWSLEILTSSSTVYYHFTSLDLQIIFDESLAAFKIRLQMIWEDMNKVITDWKGTGYKKLEHISKTTT